MTRADKSIVFAFSVLAVLSIFLTQALPKNGQVAVFGPPFSEPGEVAAIVASAGGKILGGTGLSWAIIARFETSDFQSALYRQGAIFVGDASLAISCFGRRTTNQPIG